MLDTGALAALQAAAGVAPAKLSLVIRSILLALIFIWAVWFLYGEIHHFRHHAIDVLDALRKYFRVLFIVAIAIILVTV